MTFLRLDRALLHCTFTVAAACAGLACDTDAPTEPDARSLAALDLSRFGVDAVVAEADGFALLGPGGDAVGHVAVSDARGITELEVTLDEREASVSWSDTQAAMRCDGGELVIAAGGTEEWQPQGGGAEGAGACDDALAVGLEVATALGTAPPWAAGYDEDDRFRMAPGPNTQYGVCSTVSTWVGGSSCWNCAQAAHDAFGRGPGWYETSSTCSSGTLWTSCSATYCIN
jgi:hypothetical protein